MARKQLLAVSVAGLCAAMAATAVQANAVKHESEVSVLGAYIEPDSDRTDEYGSGLRGITVTVSVSTGGLSLNCSPELSRRVLPAQRITTSKPWERTCATGFSTANPSRRMYPLVAACPITM